MIRGNRTVVGFEPWTFLFPDGEDTTELYRFLNVNFLVCILKKKKEFPKLEISGKFLEIQKKLQFVTENF